MVKLLKSHFFIKTGLAVNPLLSPSGGLFITSLFEGGLIWEGGGELFNLEKTVVSVLHKDLEYKVDKLKYKKVGGHAAEDQKQIWPFK